jgi:hypothetical protein
MSPVFRYKTTYDPRTDRMYGPVRVITRKRKPLPEPSYLEPCPREAQRFTLKELGGCAWATPVGVAACYVRMFGRPAAKGTGKRCQTRVYSQREFDLVAQQLALS